MYVLDTCICIDLMRGKLPHTYEIMRTCNPKQFVVPSMVAAELEYGVQKSQRPEETRRITERFLAPFEIVPFDAHCVRAYGQIRNQLRLDGCPIGPNDLVIAATAITQQATLITRNVKEFKRIKGLSLEDWEEVSL